MNGSTAMDFSGALGDAEAAGAVAAAVRFDSQNLSTTKYDTATASTTLIVHNANLDDMGGETGFVDVSAVVGPEGGAVVVVARVVGASGDSSRRTRSMKGRAVSPLGR